MTTDTLKRLGYGGSAVIDGIQVLITAGSFDEAGTVTYLDMYDIDPDENSRSRVKHADGTETFSGSLTFDVTQNSVELFSIDRLLKRNFGGLGSGMDVGIHDGENKYVMNGCKVSSIAISGSANGLINASVSFVGTSGKASGGVLNNYLLDYAVTPFDRPAAYWWSGQDDVRDWSLNFTQDVQPVYANRNTTSPKYLRVGLVLYSLNVTTYAELVYSDISIVTKTFTLVGDTTSKGYSFNGPTELGGYSHTFETAASAVDGSKGVVIT